ncbi:uncharacterized protein BO87DRAFT_422048 [Aspergillus neoniger CBS 115656]|uniref:Uncharacterized protein n=1 Tax=Aspergillus neoniger (strain CBS 115656) TaxID=1448310 RepID=A0A318YWS9_ASPNB|nr:hypothetical protein BO87DRAFT_422048 [Aspergillus neoniger CBS 115656]PYH38939.1 hypothetical protein BO87DRAFT_422048 [Aspergillus neoniger CBS 115656]
MALIESFIHGVILDPTTVGDLNAPLLLRAPGFHGHFCLSAGLNPHLPVGDPGWLGLSEGWCGTLRNVAPGHRAIGIGTLLTVPRIPMQASAPTAEDQALAIGILVSFRLFRAAIGLSRCLTF